MSQEYLTERIQQLEILVSEQDYTIEQLNKELAAVNLQQSSQQETLTLISRQLKEIKELLNDRSGWQSADEKPPHY